MSAHPIILPENLPRKIFEESRGTDIGPAEKLLTLKEMERSYVLKVLDKLGGNKKKASEILGIDRTTLYRLLDKK
jgi:transcriptional regulator of acetoin/glycerol metabolism